MNKAIVLTIGSAILLVSLLQLNSLLNGLGIDLLVSVPLENGTWKVHENVANYAQGTSLVSRDGGNVGLFAHDKMLGFHKIKDLRLGDTVVLSADNYFAVYQVTYSSKIEPTAVNVFLPSEKAELTMITCDGVFSSKRYMVKAQLIDFGEIYEEAE
jgi:LPXTG-site transpeptidase (sortase) family protein